MVCLRSLLICALISDIIINYSQTSFKFSFKKSRLPFFTFDKGLDMFKLLYINIFVVFYWKTILEICIFLLNLLLAQGSGVQIVGRNSKWGCINIFESQNSTKIFLAQIEKKSNPQKSITFIIKISAVNQGVMAKFYVKCVVGSKKSLHIADLGYSTVN